MDDELYDIVIVSGGFDPIHEGHIQYLKEASYLGKSVICILNNDEFLKRKKGYSLLNYDAREAILKSIRYVDFVVKQSNTESSDVCDDIRNIYEENILLNDSTSIVFAKGGDRFNGEVPETEICKKLGIPIIDGLGLKINSSSKIGSDLLSNIEASKVINKPWGNYKVIESAKDYQIKILTVNPNSRLSLQSHKNKSEFWYVLKGTASYHLEDEFAYLNTGFNLFIPHTKKHRLCNPTNEILQVLEIQKSTNNECILETDIIRYEDDYGRIEDQS